MRWLKEDVGDATRGLICRGIHDLAGEENQASVGVSKCVRPLMAQNVSDSDSRPSQYLVTNSRQTELGN